LTHVDIIVFFFTKECDKKVGVEARGERRKLREAGEE
jgi:hypothetical protein